MELGREAWAREPEVASVFADPDGQPIPATVGMGMAPPAGRGADTLLGAGDVVGPGAAAEVEGLSVGVEDADLMPDTERAGGVTAPRVHTVDTISGMVVIPIGGKRR